MYQRNLRVVNSLEQEGKFVMLSSEGITMAPDATINSPDTKVEAAALLGQRGDLWPKLTPIYFDATYGAQGAWRVWTNGQAIEGFAMGMTGMNLLDLDEGRMRLDAADTSMALLFLSGEIHASSVFLPPGETQGNLDAALRSGLREDNIRITGLYGVH